MERARNISKSMISYLRRAREQKEFLLRETKEFERGKRHLANMMGIESHEMSQDDIDDAITYLFPSGLFDKRARPMMKHPDLLHKIQKDAQFDIEGRPHHYLFYTTKPNYYDSLSQLNKTLRDLNKYEDEQLARGILNPTSDARHTLSGTEWLSHNEMCEKFIEPITEYDYNYLTHSLVHLAQQPYSAQAKSFIEQFSKELEGQSIKLQLPELLKDEETGQLYTDILVRKQEHKVQVKTILNGTGKIDIEGHDILYFEAPYLRAILLYPLQLSGMLDTVDINAKIVKVPQKLGTKAIATAIRYAVSQTIAAYVDQDTRERLRLAGLLTFDNRRKERKKFGQEGARRKYTWKKR